jgi:hypothetical protein
MPWRPAAGVGVLFAITLALSELNRISVLAREYSTSIPLSTFWLDVGVSLVVLPIVAGLGGWVLVAFATSLYPDAWRVFRPARTVWRRDAAVAIVVSLAAVAALNRLGAMVSSRFHAYLPVNIELAYDVFDAFSPGLAFFFHSLLLGISLAAAAAVGIYMVRWGWARREWWLWLGALLLLISLGPSNAHSVREFLLGWAMGFLSLLVTLAIIALFFRDNALAYLLAPFCLAIANPLVSLFSQAAKFFLWNGLLLAALALTVLGWMMFPKTTASNPAE